MLADVQSACQKQSMSFEKIMNTYIFFFIVR